MRLGLNVRLQGSATKASTQPVDPFVPTMAGSIVGGWYDATDGATITHASNVVSQWNDKSGNNRHVSQAGATTLRPTWNGTDGIVFDGGDYLFNTTPWMKANNKVAIYAVIKIAGGNGVTLIGEGSSSANNPVYSTGTRALAASTEGALFSRNDAGGVVISNGSATGALAFDDTKNLIHVWDDGGTASYALDGVTGTSLIDYVPSGTHTLNRFAIGCLLRSTASGFIVGTIHEIIICTDDSYGYEMEGYLAHKHGITSQLPSWHPYKSVAPNATNGPIPIPLVTTPVKALLFGDSITDYHEVGGAASDIAIENVGYFTTYNALAGGRMDIDLPANVMGVAGNSTAQMVARMATDLAGKNFDTVFIMGGTNDIVQLTASESSVVSNLNQFADYVCLTLGKRLVLLTPCSRSAWGSLTAPQIVTAKAKFLKINEWIMRQHGTRLGRCVSVDVYTGTNDGLGDAVANMFYDGLHPAPYGAMKMGVDIKARLASFYGNATPDYTVGNLLSNPTLSGTGGSLVNGVTNVGGLGTGYVATRVGGHYVDVNKSSGVQTFYQIRGGAGSAGDGFRVSQVVSTGFSVGDTVYGMADVEVVGTPTGVIGFRLECRLTGTGLPTLVNARGMDEGGWTGGPFVIAETYLAAGRYHIVTPNLPIASGSGLSLEWRLVAVSDASVATEFNIKIYNAGIFNR